MAKKIGFTKRDIKSINVTIGLNLAAARRNAGMTQTEVMQALWGVTGNRNRISEIENGKKDLTLTDLLIFQKLYGQSLDYICGLSTEPEVDMLAGTVNHVVNQSRQLIELLTSELASVMVTHVKAIAKNDHEALIEKTNALVDAVKNNVDPRSDEYITLMQHMNDVRQVIRHIDVKQARQTQAVDAQMMQIKERIDKEDRHRLLSDMSTHYQFSIPLVPACFIDIEDDEAVDADKNNDFVGVDCAS